MAGMTQRDAYLEAGFKASTPHSAEQAGCALLKRLEQHGDYQEIIKAFNPYYELGADVASLRKCPDPKIRLGACSVAGKWLRMEKEEVQANFGFQVLITGRDPIKVGTPQEPTQIKAPKKPTALLR
jgi:hypothetical protein